MGRSRWSVVGGAVVLLAGCAGSGPAGPPEGPGASSIPAPVAPGEATCARGARPVPSPDASFDVNDPGQRARRALAEQHRPTPTRGDVPKAAIPGAEACVYVLKLEFSLLMAGATTAPDEPAIEAALRSAGLTAIVVGSGPVFAASTGAACVHGSFTGTGPAFVIGRPAVDGSCRP